MSDAVFTAIHHAAKNFDTTAETKWVVDLANHETLRGTITSLGGHVYLLRASQPFYFSADQVVSLTISRDQS